MKTNKQIIIEELKKVYKDGEIDIDYSDEDFEEVATSILIKLHKDGVVIFKARLTKGINLSKVIEQVLYPKYIGKNIILKVVEDE